MTTNFRDSFYRTSEKNQLTCDSEYQLFFVHLAFGKIVVTVFITQKIVVKFYGLVKRPVYQQTFRLSAVRFDRQIQLPQMP